MHAVLEGFYKLPHQRRTLKYLYNRWRVVSRDLDAEYKELGRGMLEGYFEWISVMDSTRFLTVATEKRLGMMIKTALGKVMVSGQLDSLWLEKATGRLFVVDHKTYANFPNDSFYTTNPQTYVYMLLLQKNGLQASGFIYNILRKTNRVEPSVNKDGSISIRNSNVSLKSFVDTAERLKLDLNQPRYIKFMEEMQKFPAFKRVEIEYSQLRGTAALSELHVQATALLSFYKHGFYPNYSDKCGYCAFKHLCEVKSSGGNVKETIERNYSVRGTLLQVEM